MPLSREQIMDALREILINGVGDLGADPAGIGEDTALVRELGLSSIQMLFLAVLIEERFPITLEDISAIRLDTVGDVIDLIERSL